MTRGRDSCSVAGGKVVDGLLRVKLALANDGILSLQAPFLLLVFYPIYPLSHFRSTC